MEVEEEAHPLLTGYQVGIGVVLCGTGVMVGGVVWYRGAGVGVGCGYGWVFQDGVPGRWCVCADGWDTCCGCCWGWGGQVGAGIGIPVGRTRGWLAGVLSIP